MNFQNLPKTQTERLINPNYSQLFYSKAKLPTIFGNALNLFSSKVGNNLSSKNYCAHQI